MIATLRPVAGNSIGTGNFPRFFLSASVINDSSRPIATGGCFDPSVRSAKPTTHAPSQSISCGQSRPHISGKVEVSLNFEAAPSMSLFSSIFNAEGMSLCTGHASMHGADGQSIHLAASIIAESISIARYVSSKLFTRSEGSCFSIFCLGMDNLSWTKLSPSWLYSLVVILLDSKRNQTVTVNRSHVQTTPPLSQ